MGLSIKVRSTWRIFMSTTSSLDESVPTKRACVIESAICCTQAADVSQLILIRPYEMNLSMDVRAIPVTGPVVSSDLIISRNGDRKVL